MLPNLTQITRAVVDLWNHITEEDPGPNENTAIDGPDLTHPQVTNLCHLSGEESLPQLENRLYRCAQELRETAHYEEARGILHSLIRLSMDPGMRRKAIMAYQDSMGFSMTDDAGETLQEGGGRTLLWPLDWGRNFSDENAAGTVIDMGLFAALSSFVSPIVAFPALAFPIISWNWISSYYVASFRADANREALERHDSYYDYRFLPLSFAPLDISLLRSADPFSLADPNLQQFIAPILEGADSDGISNKEDDILTETEARNLLEHAHRYISRDREILARHRGELPGSLAEARRILEAEGASEALLTGLTEVAALETDTTPDDAVNADQILSIEEIGALVQGLDIPYQNLGGDRPVNDETLARMQYDIRGVLQDLEFSREWVLSEDSLAAFSEGEWNDPIDLNFLKDHSPREIIPEQSRWIDIVLGMGGIDRHDRETNWDLTMEELNAALDAMPPQERARYPRAPQITMANIRYFIGLLGENGEASE